MEDRVNLKLIVKMERFANEVTAEEIAGCSRLNTADSSRGAGGSKAPSYSSPPDYAGVETLADLRQALQAADFEKALPLYYGLKRLLNR